METTAAEEPWSKAADQRAREGRGEKTRDTEEEKRMKQSRRKNRGQQKKKSTKENERGEK